MKVDHIWVAAAAVLVLSACGGGGDAEAPVPVAGSHAARALASREPPGAQCAAGGVRIDSGLDSDGNGVLDAAEIVATQYVCNGTTGAAGAIGATGLTGLAGATGATGAAGLTTRVQITFEAPGSHCANGGNRVDAGADANANGALDTGEISSVAYVCDGAAGASGIDTLMGLAAEPAGSNCAAGGSLVRSGSDANRNGVLDVAEVAASRYLCNGSNGAAGSNGSSSLFAVVVEAPGPNCPYGGSKLTSGIDGNGNGSLETGEVGSTAYVCNGATGATGINGSNGSNGFTTLTTSVPEGGGANCAAGGIKISSGLDANRNGVLDAGEASASSFVCNGLAAMGWVDVTTPAVQAAPNTGYVADSSDRVTVTLPASAQVGDIVRISGAGSGGWSIAQNANQSVVTTHLDNSDVATIAEQWTITPAPARDWRGIASSADGTRLVAVASGWPVLTSDDAGRTWASVDTGRDWTAVASSADGRRLVATGYYIAIFVSSDYGVTWVARDINRAWAAVASSADGRVLAAVEAPGRVFVSTDYGVSWASNSAFRDWRAVAISADGSRIVAAASGDRIDISADSGATWTTGGSVAAWKGIASSADGSKLVAVADQGRIETSSDFGITWTARDSARAWTAVTSSADGSRLVAVTSEDIGLSTTVFAYSSDDQGVTWTQRAPSDARIAVASSADGTRIAAAGSGQQGTGTIWHSAPARALATSVGIGGSIAGAQYSAIELQCIGVDRFMVIDAIGTRFDVR